MSLSGNVNMYIYYGGVTLTTIFMGYRIAQRNQAILLAASRLPLPTRPTDSPAPTSKARKIVMGVLGAVAFITAIFTPAIFLVYVLPQIKSQRLLDGITLGVVLALYYPAFWAALWTLHAGVAWEWNNGVPKLAMTPVSTAGLRPVLAVFSAIGTAMFFFVHYNQPAAAWAAIMPLLIIAGVRPLKWSVRWLYYMTIGLFAWMVITGLWNWPLWSWSVTPDERKAQPVETLWPSEWVFSMFYPFWFSFGGTMLFLTWLSIALRFDASQTRPIATDANIPEIFYSGDQPIAKVGAPLKNPRKPTFWSGMVMIALTAISSMYLINVLVPDPKDQHICMLGIGTLANNITVPLGMAICAWWDGNFKAWWNFSDESNNMVDLLEGRALDDVESLLDEEAK